MKFLPYLIVVIIASMYIYFTFYSEANPSNEITKKITQNVDNQQIDSVELDTDTVSFNGCGMSFLFQKLDGEVNRTIGNNYLIVKNHITEDIKPDSFYTFSYNDFLKLDENNKIYIEQFINKNFSTSYCSDLIITGQKSIQYLAIDGQIKFSYKKVGEYFLQNVVLKNFTFQISNNQTFKLKEATFKNVDVSTFAG